MFPTISNCTGEAISKCPPTVLAVPADAALRKAPAWDTAQRGIRRPQGTTKQFLRAPLRRHHLRWTAPVALAEAARGPSRSPAVRQGGSLLRLMRTVATTRPARLNRGLPPARIA